LLKADSKKPVKNHRSDSDDVQKRVTNIVGAQIDITDASQTTSSTGGGGGGGARQSSSGGAGNMMRCWCRIE